MASEIRKYGYGCGAQDLGLRAQGLGLRVQGSGFRVQGSGFRVQGLGFRVQGSGFRVQGRPESQDWYRGHAPACLALLRSSIEESRSLGIVERCVCHRRCRGIHINRVTHQSGHTPIGSHTNRVTCQSGHTPIRSHTNRVTNTSCSTGSNILSTVSS